MQEARRGQVFTFAQKKNKWGQSQLKINMVIIYDAAGDISTEKTLPAASAPLAVSSADMAYGAGNRLAKKKKRGRYPFFSFFVIAD